MLITSSTWCCTIRISHGMWPPYIFIISLKTVLYTSLIIWKCSNVKLKKYLAIWNIQASRIIYFRLHKSKLKCFVHWHQQEISWGKFGRGSQCGDCQSNARGRGEVRSQGGGKVPGSVSRPWSHDAGHARVKTATSGKYHKTPFLREIRRGNQEDE